MKPDSHEARVEKLLQEIRETLQLLLQMAQADWRRARGFDT